MPRNKILAAPAVLSVFSLPFLTRVAYAAGERPAPVAHPIMGTVVNPTPVGHPILGLEVLPNSTPGTAGIGPFYGSFAYDHPTLYAAAMNGAPVLGFLGFVILLIGAVKWIRNADPKLAGQKAVQVGKAKKLVLIGAICLATCIALVVLVNRIQASSMLR